MPNKKIEISEEVENIEFPENSDQIIAQLLEQYGLQKSQEEGINKFIELVKSKTIVGRSKLFNNLPGTKISKLAREYAEGKITAEKFPTLLKDDLKIPEKEARKLAEDLEDKILNQIKPAEKKKTLLATAPTPSLEKRERSQRQDSYREPIE